MVDTQKVPTRKFRMKKGSSRFLVGDFSAADFFVKVWNSRELFIETFPRSGGSATWGFVWRIISRSSRPLGFASRRLNSTMLSNGLGPYQPVKIVARNRCWSIPLYGRRMEQI